MSNVYWRYAPHATTYRVDPSVPAAGVFLAYVVVVIGLEYMSGISYEEWFASAANAYRGAVLPFATGSALLVAFTWWSRWDFVWRDRARMPMHWLGWLPAAGVVLMFLLRLIGLEWVSIPSDLIIAALIAASLVGFAEETLFRGVILRGLRTHNRSEGVVIVVTTVWFSAFHLVNIFLGLTFGEALLQSVIAACLGAILYLFRRGSGWLVAGMSAHALWDLSSSLHTSESGASGLFALAGLLSFLVYGMGAIALVFSWYRNRQRVGPTHGEAVAAQLIGGR
ncbi:MAG: CPBP family intramembrane metalloprotease [Caldilineaceae bacterium]|nr:CPBP family intramembrane metalloprotease [Caldilineaceae bacterium]